MALPPDRVVLITGASSGIGRAAAFAFARDGARVALAARRVEALETAAREIGERALAVPCDVRRRDEVRAAVEKTVHHFGALHVVVANAGIGLYTAIEDMTDEDLDAVFRTNVYGAVYAVQEALPHLRTTRGSQAIFISSILGRASMPYMGPYGMSKHALTALADALRLEVADDGVEVILIGPGLTATEFQRNAVSKVRGFIPAGDNAGGWPPERVADAILAASKKRKREVYLTADGRLLIRLKYWLPRLAEWGIRRWIRARLPEGRERT